jgi:hypothetical protein
MVRTCIVNYLVSDIIKAANLLTRIINISNVIVIIVLLLEPTPCLVIATSVQLVDLHRTILV